MKKYNFLLFALLLTIGPMLAQSNSLHFDGSNDYVSLSNPASLQILTGTVEAWIKTSNAGSGHRAIIVKQDAFGIYLYNNQLIVYDYGGSGNIYTPVFLNDNQWHHIAFTFIENGKTYNVYSDGNLVRTATYTGNRNQSKPLMIGEGGTNANQFFAGEIDEVRIWNYPRSINDIKANKNIEVSTGNDLVSAYHFNQGVAGGNNAGVNSLTDAKGNNTGTLYSFALNGSTSNWVAGAIPLNSVAPMSLFFNGTNQYVDLGQNIVPASYTKEAWIYVDGANGKGNNFISGQTHALWAPNTFNYKLSAGHNGVWNYVQEGTQIPFAQWQHVAVTYDAATLEMKLYRNGVLVDEAANVPNFTPGSRDFIGAYNYGYYLGGRADEVRIWSTVLTDLQIATLYDDSFRDPSIPSDCLEAYYQMNEGFANLLVDVSGNGHLGNIIGSANWQPNGPPVTSQITSNCSALSTFTFSGAGTDWNLASNWANEWIPTGVLPSGDYIYINGGSNSTNLNVDQVLESGSFLYIQNSKILNINSGFTLTNNGTIFIFGSLTNSGTMICNGTIATGTVLNSGTMKGTGSLLSLLNTSSGIIAPGSSPGKLTILNFLNLGSGTYHCEINGTGQGTSYDLIDVKGTANLTDAKLVVDWGSFTPTAGQTFNIINYFNRVGTFAAVTIPPVAGLSFTISYTSTNVILNVAAAPLPVELVFFEANPFEKIVQLTWQTASESNNEGFEVQHSVDGYHWDAIGFVNGYGTTDKTHDYFFTDRTPKNENNYYRLRQVDFDGSEVYSKTTQVQFDNEFGMPRIFPTVTTGLITIDANGKTIREINIFNTLGQRVPLSGYTEQVDLSAMEAGVYFIQLILEDRTLLTGQVIKR